jgi:hypothetical protein
MMGSSMRSVGVWTTGLYVNFLTRPSSHDNVAEAAQRRYLLDTLVDSL